MHLGPDEVLLALDINFRHELTAAEVEVAVDCLERGIGALHPSIKRIFIEAQSVSIGREQRAQQATRLAE